MSSGEGTASTSGAVTIRSVNGGEAGSSGVLMFSSGSSSGYVYGKWLEPSLSPLLYVCCQAAVS